MLARMNTDHGAQDFGTLVPKMDEQDRVRYARKIKTARQALNMTQAQVAEAADVSRNTVLAIESGKSTPQADKLWRVMLAVGVRPDGGEPDWLDGWLAVLVPQIKRIPATDRGRVLGEVTRVIYEAVHQR